MLIPLSRRQEGVDVFFLFLKPSWTWLTATRITLWIWIFRLSLHARVTSWNLGLLTGVCFSWHSSSSQNKASSGETWHTQFPINNRPYIIDNIVHTWSTFMMVNAHDGEQNIYIWTCYLWEGATVVLLFVLVISMLWWNLLCTLGVVNTISLCPYHESLPIPWVHVYTMSPCLRELLKKK